ncbi:type II toxin-antitoxin system HicB family antitoxin [Chloroflexota bacterium]
MVVAGIPYMINSYTVVVHEADEGGYWGEILELPGCVSQGETIEEFRENIREALDTIINLASQEPSIQILTGETRDEQSDYIIYGDTWTAVV